MGAVQHVIGLKLGSIGVYVEKLHKTSFYGEDIKDENILRIILLKIPKDIDFTFSLYIKNIYLCQFGEKKNIKIFSDILKSIKWY